MEMVLIRYLLPVVQPDTGHRAMSAVRSNSELVAELTISLSACRHTKAVALSDPIELNGGSDFSFSQRIVCFFDHGEPVVSLIFHQFLYFQIYIEAFFHSRDPLLRRQRHLINFFPCRAPFAVMLPVPVHAQVAGKGGYLGVAI